MRQLWTILSIAILCLMSASVCFAQKLDLVGNLTIVPTPNGDYEILVTLKNNEAKDFTNLNITGAVFLNTTDANKKGKKYVASDADAKNPKKIGTLKAGAEITTSVTIPMAAGKTNDQGELTIDFSFDFDGKARNVPKAVKVPGLP